MGDVKLQSHLGQETCGAVGVVHRIRAQVGRPRRCWDWRRKGGRRGHCGGGGWRCSAGLICHTDAFCDTEKMRCVIGNSQPSTKPIHQQRQTRASTHTHTQITVVPAGLRSFPGMYASIFISEKVTVAPPSSNVATLKQRYVVLTLAEIPTEVETTVTTSRANNPKWSYETWNMSPSVFYCSLYLITYL